VFYLQWTLIDLFYCSLQPTLVSVSNHVSFINPKAPVYPRLALGKKWDEMTVTWTSGYNIGEAVPFVEWSRKGTRSRRSPAGTLTFTRNSMCGMYETRNLCTFLFI
jgi:hypothetical protein